MLIRLIQGGYSPREIILYAVIMIFALTLSFSVHEFMHAFVADRLGDPTPGNMGRLTLNPAAHVDPMGVVCMLIAGFGWGKPVPYNPTRLRKWKNRRAMVIAVNLAGVTGNFILALISRIILLFVMHFAGEAILTVPVIQMIVSLLLDIEAFSMCLLGFNLLPIPPLDGFNVLDELLPYRLKYKDGYRKFIQYSPMVLMGLIILSYISGFDILGILIGLIQLPFQLLINLLCTPFAMLLQVI